MMVNLAFYGPETKLKLKMKSDPIIALIISSQQYDKKKTNTEESTCHRSSMSDLIRFIEISKSTIV